MSTLKIANLRSNVDRWQFACEGRRQRSTVILLGVVDCPPPKQIQNRTFFKEFSSGLYREESKYFLSLLTTKGGGDRMTFA